MFFAGTFFFLSEMALNMSWKTTFVVRRNNTLIFVRNMNNNKTKLAEIVDIINVYIYNLVGRRVL